MYAGIVVLGVVGICVGAKSYLLNDADPIPNSLNAGEGVASAQRARTATEWESILGAVLAAENSFVKVQPGLVGDAQRKILSVEQNAVSDAESAAIHEFIASKSELVDELVHQIGQGGPLRRDTLDPRAAEIDYDFYAAVRGANNLIRLAALNEILESDADGRYPMRYIWSSLDLADLVGEEQLLQSYSNKCHQYLQTGYILKFWLSVDVLTEKDCESLRERMAANRDPAQFRAALENDFILRRLEFDGLSVGTQPMWWARGRYADVQKMLTRSPVGSVFASVDERFYVSRLEGLVDLIDGSYADNVEAFGLFQQSIRESLSFTGFGALALQIELNAVLKNWRHHTITYMIDISTYAEAYERAHGRYPESLEDLSNFVEVDLPTDPFTNKAFEYEPRENGFSLRSDGGGHSPDGATPNPVIEWIVMPPE